MRSSRFILGPGQDYSSSAYELQFAASHAKALLDNAKASQMLAQGSYKIAIDTEFDVAIKIATCCVSQGLAYTLSFPGLDCAFSSSEQPAN